MRIITYIRKDNPPPTPPEMVSIAFENFYCSSQAINFNLDSSSYAVSAVNVSPNFLDVLGTYTSITLNNSDICFNQNITLVNVYQIACPDGSFVDCYEYQYEDSYFSRVNIKFLDNSYVLISTITKDIYPVLDTTSATIPTGTKYILFEYTDFVDNTYTNTICDDCPPI